MNESVALLGGPELMRNSLILTGLALRTFSAIDSVCLVPLAWSIHEAWPTRSPFRSADPDVTLNVALTLAPGATGPAKVFEVSEPFTAAADHCSGTARLSLMSTAGAPVVFLNVTTVSCEEAGVNVCSPGGVVVSEAGATLTGNTP